jgi:transposase
MMVEGFVDGAAFRAFVQEVLVPQLQPGQVVVLDHLKAPQVAGVREAIQAVGARLVYLPPDSPDFSPIEECWSKIKAILRTKAARTLEQLWQAITEAFAAITSPDAQGWFTHAGYRAQSKCKELYLGGRGHSRELMGGGLDLVYGARDDEIIADHRSQAQLMVGPTCDLSWRRGSWLQGLNANAGIDDLTPMARGQGKDGIEVELGDLRDFFNHQRDPQ